MLLSRQNQVCLTPHFRMYDFLDQIFTFIFRCSMQVNASTTSSTNSLFIYIYSIIVYMIFTIVQFACDCSVSGADPDADDGICFAGLVATPITSTRPCFGESTNENFFIICIFL